MKEAYYFSHDYNARNDQKILMLRGKFGNEGYALYFYVLETMAEETDGFIYREAMGGLSVGYGVTTETLVTFIDYCIEVGLLKEDGSKRIFSARMLEHKNARKLFSKKGKEGAERRWGGQKNSPPNAKERKGKERKIYNSNSNELELSKLLVAKIIENNPEHSFTRMDDKAKEKFLQGYAYHVDLMLRIDKRTPDQIKFLIKWSQDDAFWKGNILSMSKLREQFDQLVIKCKSEYEKVKSREIPEIN